MSAANDYSDLAWERDHQAVKNYQVPAEDMAEKWAGRGGAFLGYLADSRTHRRLCRCLACIGKPRG